MQGGIFWTRFVPGLRVGHLSKQPRKSWEPWQVKLYKMPETAKACSDCKKFVGPKEGRQWKSWWYCLLVFSCFFQKNW